MNILDQIIAHKHREVEIKKFRYPVEVLENAPHFQRTTVSLHQTLQSAHQSGIIAEFKRRSPSKGDIHSNAEVKEITSGYVQGGASALSILTDESFFGGRREDLPEARRLHRIPILRKDFIIDEYQILEAKAMGADIVLLIAECLDKKHLAQLARTARGLGLEVLMEIHSAPQLDKYIPEIDAIGVNNRNLENFTVSLETSLRMIDVLPGEVTKVAESGLNTPSDILLLREAGYRGFLIGEHFMRRPDPGLACAAMISRIITPSMHGS